MAKGGSTAPGKRAAVRRPPKPAVLKKPKKNDGNGGGRSKGLAEAAQKEIDAKAAGEAATPSIAGWLGKRNVVIVNPNPKDVVVVEDGVDASLVGWDYEGSVDGTKQGQKQIIGRASVCVCVSNLSRGELGVSPPGAPGRS